MFSKVLGTELCGVAGFGVNECSVFHFFSDLLHDFSCVAVIPQLF